MNEIKVPPIGTRVEIETFYSIEWMNFPKPPIVGIVAHPNAWDKPETLRVVAREDVFGKTHYESTISIDRVKSLKVLGTSEEPDNPNAVNVPDPTTATVMEIEGSKGDLYTVTLDGNKASCTCQAGSRGRICRHIKIAREKLAAG